MIFYHVDRTDTLKNLKTIELIHPHVLPAELNETLLELFPGGLSFHGDQYAIESFKDFHKETSTEQIFELYRRMYFPDKPSRFQSFFAFTSLEDAINFALKYPFFKIYEVSIDHDNYHIGDMNLVKGETIIQCHKLALDYWSGRLSNEPLKEALLIPPIHIDRLLILS